MANWRSHDGEPAGQCWLSPAEAGKLCGVSATGLQHLAFNDPSFPRPRDSDGKYPRIMIVAWLDRQRRYAPPGKAQ